MSWLQFQIGREVLYSPVKAGSVQVGKTEPYSSPDWDAGKWAASSCQIGIHVSGTDLGGLTLMCTYSGGHRGDSIGDACRGLGSGDTIGDSMGLPPGVGDCTSISAVTKKAGL